MNKNEPQRSNLSANEPLEVIYLLDFDRCLGNTSEIAKQFNEFTLEQSVLSPTQIAHLQADQKATEAIGRTFDMFSNIQAELGSETATRLLYDFHAELQSNEFLMPGADKLIDLFESRGDRFALCTYPIGPAEWQFAKIHLIPKLKDVDIWMVETPDKGELISSLNDIKSGYFALPIGEERVKVKSVILIDDKADSFANFPLLPSRGYWVVDLETALESQKGTVADNVVHVKTLDDVVSAEQSSDGDITL